MSNDDQQPQISQRQQAGGNITNAPQIAGNQNIINTVPNYGAQRQFHGDVNFITNLPTPAQRLYQLRAPIGDFIGREQEIAELIRALCAGSGAAAITGIRRLGGIGKTELAYVVANRLCDYFGDAQIVVELFGASNPLTPEAALQAVIRSFEPQAKLPDDLPTLKQQYAEYLHGKRVLILADDAKDAAQVCPLLPPVGCALLITSRYTNDAAGQSSAIHTNEAGQPLILSQDGELVELEMAEGGHKPETTHADEAKRY